VADAEYTVLVCDDDEDIRAALEIYLSQEGYAVVQAGDGFQAVDAVRNRTIHLVLLDVMMPRLDGIKAAVTIRRTSNVPIVFLSAKTEETDRILGLNMGGDDYVTKPFNPVELMARVRAALRRYARLGGLAGSTDESDAEADGVLRTGGLVLDDAHKRVTVDDREVALTAIEFGILRFLMTNLDRVYSSEQIYEEVWGEPAFNVAKLVSVHVRHIREKIEINPRQPRYLTVVYGFGYKVVRLT